MGGFPGRLPAFPANHVDLQGNCLFFLVGATFTVANNLDEVILRVVYNVFYMVVSGVTGHVCAMASSYLF